MLVAKHHSLVIFELIYALVWAIQSFWFWFLLQLVWIHDLLDLGISLLVRVCVLLLLLFAPKRFEKRLRGQVVSFNCEVSLVRVKLPIESFLESSFEISLIQVYFLSRVDQAQFVCVPIKILVHQGHLQVPLRCFVLTALHFAFGRTAPQFS